jgi:hypothetical protein
MTARRSAKAGQSAKDRAPKRSVYIGRQRLGRYICVRRKHFKAFDSSEGLLGKFQTEKEAVAAILIAGGPIS